MADRMIHSFRSKLQSAGVSASVSSLAHLQDDEEPAGSVVAVVTQRPYDAWCALTGLQDLSMAEHPPVSIAERIDGLDVVIGTEQAFLSFQPRAAG